MQIEATIIADSISPIGKRITTFQLKYPRFIHSEFLTHRLFSRNSRSSRAVPTERLLKEIREEPAMPCHWGKNQPGMQANEELQGEDRELAMTMWCQAADWAALQAEKMLKKGIHKQVVNRILEPYTFMHTVVTATEWENFFGLRIHPDAQPEMRLLAQAMWNVYRISKPFPLRPGQWHLPYLHIVFHNGGLDGYRMMKPDGDDWVELDLATAIKCSVAMCARVSYKEFDGKWPTVESNLALYEKLVGSQPMHASPAEHQATPDKASSAPQFDWYQPQLHGNFVGWIQFRKTLQGEAVAPFAPFHQ